MAKIARAWIERATSIRRRAKLAIGSYPSPRRRREISAVALIAIPLLVAAFRALRSQLIAPTLAPTPAKDALAGAPETVSLLGHEREAPRDSSGPGLAPTCFAALFALSVLIALAGHGLEIDALRLIGLFGVLLFGLGAAPLQLLDEMDLAQRLGLSGLIGLASAVAVGALMADIRSLWHPVLAAIVVGGAASALHLIALRRALRSRPRGSLRAILATASRTGRKLISRPRVSVLTSLAGTALWLGSAITEGHINPGIGGFLTTISPLWFTGLILVLVSIAFEQHDERLLAFSVLSLAVATTLTPALAYGTPRSQSAAKQIELVRLILRNHHIAPGAGIYQAYSAFFAGIAWIARIAGVGNLLGLATFWPVLLAFVRVAELRFLAGQTVSSAARRWTAVTLVILVDAIGADYFSPQSLGYVMALGMLGLVVRGATARPLGRRGTFALLVVASLALGPAHELSPFMVAGALAVLAVFGLAPSWAPVVVALPAVAWAALEHKVVSHVFSFSQVFSVSNFAPPQTVATFGLRRMTIVGLSSHALLLGIVVLTLAAAIGFVQNVEHRWAWAYGLSSGVGLAFVAINPYGNEGIFRAALFGIPWLAVLAAQATVADRLRSIGRLRRYASAGVCATFVILLATFVIAAYGMDGSDVLRRSDFLAGQFFISQSPSHAFILTLGYGDNPVNAPLFSSDDISLPWDQVVLPAMLREGQPTAPELPRLTRSYERAAQKKQATPDSRLYILWSQELLVYSEEYALQSASQTRMWLRLLLESPNWQLVFHQDFTYLFRLRKPLARVPAQPAR